VLGTFLKQENEKISLKEIHWYDHILKGERKKKEKTK
jgi:hypothetical protein